MRTDRAAFGMPATPDGPIGMVGFSMGGSWALWAATRFPEQVDAVTTFYGGQDIDFAPAEAAFQGHFAEHDEFVPDDDRAYLSTCSASAGLHDAFYAAKGGIASPFALAESAGWFAGPAAALRTFAPSRASVSSRSISSMRIPRAEVKVSCSRLTARTSS